MRATLKIFGPTDASCRVLRESCPTCEWAVSHIEVSRVPHMNGLCQIWQSYDSVIRATYPTHCNAPLIREAAAAILSGGNHWWVMPYIKCHVLYTNSVSSGRATQGPPVSAILMIFRPMSTLNVAVSCVTDMWLRHATYEWVVSHVRMSHDPWDMSQTCAWYVMDMTHSHVSHVDRGSFVTVQHSLVRKLSNI